MNPSFSRQYVVVALLGSKSELDFFFFFYLLIFNIILAMSKYKQWVLLFSMGRHRFKVSGDYYYNNLN